MYLFTLLLFPCAFAYYMARHFSEVRSHFLIPLVSVIVAALVCAFRAFYMFRSPYAGANLLVFWAESAFACAVFPHIVYALFLLIARGDWRAKIDSYALFMLPFYAVYLFAEIFANPVPLPSFLLLIKPILYVVMVIAVAAELRVLFAVFAKRGRALVVSALVLLAELVAPALIESLWYYAFPAVLWCALSVAYVALCGVRSHLLGKIKGDATRI